MKSQSWSEKETTGGRVWVITEQELNETDAHISPASINQTCRSFNPDHCMLSDTIFQL